MSILFIGDEDSTAEPQEFKELRRKYPNLDWWTYGDTALTRQVIEWGEQNDITVQYITNPHKVSDYPFSFFKYFDRIVFAFGHGASKSKDAMENYLLRAKKEKIPVQKLVKPFR
jgi:hypothetical protein